MTRSIVVISLSSLLLAVLQSCNNPSLDAPQPSNPNVNISQDPPNYPILVGEVRARVVDRNTGDSIDFARVYFDCFLSRPFPPYVDSYLITSDIPGQTFSTTGGSGFVNFNFKAQVSDSRRDTIFLIMSFATERTGYRSRNSQFDLDLPYVVKDDSIIFETPIYEIAISSIQ